MAIDADFPSDLRALERDYELIREIGLGGMAAVYLARKRVNGRLVAIKAMRGKYLDDPDAVQRFAREARTVAGLDHPNIVRTEAIEQIDDRAVAIIMEHVPGGTVRDWLREHGSLGAEHAEAILRDVANGLGYAHRRGLVHRDVKPENVFLDEVRGRALLSDFGIARKIDGDGAITLLGAALGTPQYMSPEQIDGEMVDGRSDIYSLGVLGWELLTGRRPWAGESLYGVIYKQKHEQLPRITSLRPRVPANLLFAIEGALLKSKADRWQTIDEFLDQLTYNPPPLLSQTYPPGASRVDDEPTVRFRSATLLQDEPPSTASVPAAVPPQPEPEVAVVPGAVGDVVQDRDVVPARTTDMLAADAAASPAESSGSITDVPIVKAEPNAEPPFAFTSRRLKVAKALALVVPLAIAAMAMFVVVGDPRGASRVTRRSTDVTSSAGSVLADSVPTAKQSAEVLATPAIPSDPRGRLGIDAGSSVSVAPATPETSTTFPSTRAGGSSTANGPTTQRRRPRIDSSRSVVAVRPPGTATDSSGLGAPAAKGDGGVAPPVASPPVVDDPFKIPPSPERSSRTLGVAGSEPSARCRVAATADQRACLAAYIQAGDASMNQTFDSLVSEMRRVAGTPPGAPDPSTVQRARVEQRAWLSVREAECPRQAAPSAGELWARAQSQCFTEMAVSRTKELREAVRGLRRR